MAVVDNVFWTGTQFIVSLASGCMLYSSDGINWGQTDIYGQLDATCIKGIVRKFYPVNKGNTTYLTGVNYDKPITLEQPPIPRVPSMASPTPNMKFVVKVK